MMLRLLCNSRHAAAVALLALMAGQWLSCSCAAPAIAAEEGHGSTTVQDPHACCDAPAGLRAGSTCCSESTLHRESAVIASAIDSDWILTPAALATGTPQTIGQRLTPVPTLAAGITRPPLALILRI
jgi:hypothetical protein